VCGLKSGLEDVAVLGKGIDGVAVGIFAQADGGIFDQVDIESVHSIVLPVFDVVKGQYRFGDDASVWNCQVLDINTPGVILIGAERPRLGCHYQPQQGQSHHEYSGCWLAFHHFPSHEFAD